MNTYLKFERSLVAKETAPQDSRKIWDSIVVRPFFVVLEEQKSDLLVVWGVRLWNNLPNMDWTDLPVMTGRSDKK